MKIAPLIGIALILGFTAFFVNSGAQGSFLNFSALVTDGYDQDDVNTLQGLYNAIVSYGGLSQQQILFMLSQALVETGLFTDVANYNLIQNYNNYAGIKGPSDGGYPAGANGFAVYPSVNDFVSDWVEYLTKKNNPLGATSLTDFNNRLAANGFYGNDSPTLYLSNLNTWYNLLNSIVVQNGANS